MSYSFSAAQMNRLSELAVTPLEPAIFETAEARQRMFSQLEKEGVKKNRRALTRLIETTHKPALCTLSENLARALCAQGFTQVTTPTIISSKALKKMTITPQSPLYKQVFHLDGKTCLRPMLAPGLYEVSQRLLNSQKQPLGIFEIGSCFRKESEGNTHLKEFTMLNVVEWGTPMESRLDRLKTLGALVLDAAEIPGYCFKKDHSVVYGEGLDLVSPDGLELASTSMGPHPLDDAWKITCTWVGIGFGLERLLMFREKTSGIHRHSKSTTFLDGACLKLK